MAHNCLHIGPLSRSCIVEIVSLLALFVKHLEIDEDTGRHLKAL